MIFDLLIEKPKAVTIVHKMTIKGIYMLKFTFITSIFILCSYASIAQCTNKVEVEKASAVKNSGVIELKITSNKSFTCVLFAEKATGNEQMQQVSGNGSETVKFEKLNPNLIYRVDVNFIGEDNKFCKQLSRSQIILSSK